MSNCIDDFWNKVAVLQTIADTGVSVKTKEYKEYEQGKRTLNSLVKDDTSLDYIESDNDTAYGQYNHNKYINKHKNYTEKASTILKRNKIKRQR